MPVAKSFQSMEIVTEPYTVNGRKYVKVKNPNTGVLKQVRWYSESQYQVLYHEPFTPEVPVTDREKLNFVDEYIIIFKGDTYTHRAWFKALNATYKPTFGWYFTDENRIPEAIPRGIEPIRLYWNDIGNEDGMLFPEQEVKMIVNSLIYEPSKSNFVGEIGETLELELTVKKIISLQNQFGSVMHIFEDDKENVFIWTTASHLLKKDVKYIVKGKVKRHASYQNVNQTILTYCKAKEITNESDDE